MSVINFELRSEPGHTHITGVPDGCDALILGELLETTAEHVLHISSDDVRMNRVADAVAWFAPGTRILRFPAWDCLPYDRVPPRGELVAERLATLAALASLEGDGKPVLVVSTVAAILQRVPPRAALADAQRVLVPGEQVDLDAIVSFLSTNGYHRTETVREPGEFAVRGDIVDVFAPGFEEPVRIDLFGDEIEKLRRFDALNQLTTQPVERLTLLPSSEILLDDEAVALFRTRYR
ncbi:MAG: transcription-repair coupling factor, partial [Alphaproteobacteria bacterium]